MPTPLVHHTTRHFRDCLRDLPEDIQRVARSQYQLLKQNPRHPSLRFERKSPSDYYGVRVNSDYRALAVKSPADGSYIWAWIGTHADYDRMLKRKR